MICLVSLFLIPLSLHQERGVMEVYGIGDICNTAINNNMKREIVASRSYSESRELDEWFARYRTSETALGGRSRGPRQTGDRHLERQMAEYSWHRRLARAERVAVKRWISEYGQAIPILITPRHSRINALCISTWKWSRYISKDIARRK